MKNSPLSAVVLFGIAGLIGGVAYMATGDSRIEADPAVVAAPVQKTPKVMQITPHERKLAKNLADAREELEEYKRTGKVLKNGAIKVIDDGGTPMLVHPELIEGVGRYGEPLYMKATYKKRAAVPLLRDMKTPKNAAAQPTMRKLPKGQTPITLGGKRPGTQKKVVNPNEGGGGSKSANDAPGSAESPPETTDG
ncbi:MAG: hypothetical protein P8N09_06060 [Planctomycetota bacterium]|nr:hypothetical protein [Planctomycetota bacterium]